MARQPAEPPGFPTTWGTHAIDFGGYQAGTPQEADYAMDPRIVEDPRYGPMVQEGLLALPTISLVTDQDALFEIYSRPRDRGREMERPVSVEWIDPQGQVPDFQLNAGLRIQGGAGRWEFMPKHSFRLFFRREYGAAYLTVPLFTNSPVDRFDTLILRGGVDRSFAGHPWAPDNPIDHRLDTYARDEWARASQIAMSGLGSHGRFVHLYLNGLYWGIYNLVERPDESFAAAYLGGQKEEWSSANHSGPVSGPLDRINVLIQLAQAGGLADPEKYATMLEFIDPIQFSDYIILNWYAGNRDWPENNWYVVVQNPAGRNLFFVWDAERTWEDGAAIVLGSDGFEGAPYPNVVKLVFTALMENPEFRLLFADRLYRHLYHGGALSQKNALARWEAITAPLEKAIAAESARWGDARYPEPITPDDWQRARALVAEQMVGNADRLIEMARAQGFYPPIDPPTFSQQGGTFADRLALTLSAPQGEIYYTLDGSDPRQPGSGQVAPGARRYLGDPLLLTTATTVKARVKVGETWSALQEATFRREGQRSDVRITEIMYDPVGGNDYEFIELKNLGSVTAHLGGAYFEGIDFVFPRYTRLAPGAFLVLVRDFKDFRRRYPQAEIGGIYQGRLANEGETIALYSATGQPITSVTYSSDDGWPQSAAGAGDSLVLVDPQGDPNLPESWRASAELYGSPGRDDPPVE